MSAPTAPTDRRRRATGSVARVLLLIQAVFVGLLTVLALLWAIFEEPYDPPTPMGRDFRADEAGMVAAFATFVGLTVVGWWRLGRGRPRFALVLAGVMLLLTAPTLLSGFELAWFVALQGGIVVSAFRARHQPDDNDVGEIGR